MNEKDFMKMLKDALGYTEDKEPKEHKEPKEEVHKTMHMTIEVDDTKGSEGEYHGKVLINPYKGERAIPHAVTMLLATAADMVARDMGYPQKDIFADLEEVVTSYTLRAFRDLFNGRM